MNLGRIFVTKREFCYSSVSKQTGDPCQNFPPLPAPQSRGGGAVIPCSFIISVTEDGRLNVVEKIQSALNSIDEKSVIKITISLKK